MQKRAFQRLLYMQKIEGQNSSMSTLRSQKQVFMMEREEILKQREDHLAQTSDAKDKVENLRAELRQMETRIDNLQKLRSELISR